MIRVLKMNDLYLKDCKVQLWIFKNLRYYSYNELLYANR
jgi:hypothetical protein